MPSFYSKILKNSEKLTKLFKNIFMYILIIERYDAVDMNGNDFLNDINSTFVVRRHSDKHGTRYLIQIRWHRISREELRSYDIS